MRWYVQQRQGSTLLGDTQQSKGKVRSCADKQSKGKENNGKEE